MRRDKSQRINSQHYKDAVKAQQLQAPSYEGYIDELNLQWNEQHTKEEREGPIPFKQYLWECQVTLAERKNEVEVLHKAGSLDNEEAGAWNAYLNILSNFTQKAIDRGGLLV